MYPVLVYVVEARRHHVAVLGPSVNGPWESTPQEWTVRCGLRLLQGAINAATLERIHAAARHRPFASVADLCGRVELTPADLERLIAAGTLDELASSRRDARWEAQYAHVRPLDQTSLLDEGTWPRPAVVESESTWERAMEEYATLGFPLSVEHPLDLHAVEPTKTCIVCAEQLGAYVGRRVTVMGVVVAGRRIRTANGRLMAFASVCDRAGVLEMTLFEDAAERYAGLLQVGSVLMATGVVTQDVERGVGVEAHTLWPLQARGEAQAAYSTGTDWTAWAGA